MHRRWHHTQQVFYQLCLTLNNHLHLLRRLPSGVALLLLVCQAGGVSTCIS
jgi:hypothetical protein